MTLHSQNHFSKCELKFTKKDGMTKQSHKKECDINQIMAKYQKTGVIDHVNKHSDQYGFATSNDLHVSLNLIKTANEMFDELPSQARKKFQNDPAQFLDFVQDPKNEEHFFELGLSEYPLIQKTETETATTVEDFSTEEAVT